jgi:hypothetical protein
MSHHKESGKSITRRGFLTGTAAAVTTGALSPTAQAPLEKQTAKEEGSAFPKDFLWGAASSAHQVEGAARADGRGPSIWDDFSQRVGATFRGETAETACDHYHCYRERGGRNEENRHARLPVQRVVVASVA